MPMPDLNPQTYPGSTCVTPADARKRIAPVLPISLLWGISKLNSSAVPCTGSCSSYIGSYADMFASHADHYADDTNG